MPCDARVQRRNFCITSLMAECPWAFGFPSKIPVDLVEGLTFEVLDKFFGKLPWSCLPFDLSVLLHALPESIDQGQDFGSYVEAWL